MVMVTKYKYYMNDNFVHKLDLMSLRCTNKKKRQDAVLINEGAEGEGKTTMSIAEAFYVAEQTGRKFDESHVFFDIDKLITFAQSTKEQIIIWDEPALQSLGDDSRGKVVRDLIRFLMMARKKRHFIIINITHFNKFNDYIIVDRPVGMVKIYSDKVSGRSRFAYIPKNKLSKLWYDWRMKRKKTYHICADKKCRGTFNDILSESYKGNVLEGFDVDKYEANKDEAILSIGTTKNDKKREEINLLKGVNFILSKRYNIPQQEIGELTGHNASAVSKWGKYGENNVILLEKLDKKSKFLKT